MQGSSTATDVSLQSKTVTPSSGSIIVTADNNYTGLSQVTVEAIASDYVGSGIARRDSSNLGVSGANVTALAGYYEANATASVATAAQATPTVSINTSNGLITSTVTQSTGYVTGSTKSATFQLTTKAATTITPSESTQTAVAANVYTTGAIKVAAITASYVGSGVATKSSADMTMSGATAVSYTHLRAH